MTLTATRIIEAHRPFPVVIVITLLTLLGLGAVGGGYAMIFGIGGEDFMSQEYLEALPLVNSWLVPGLVLMFGFGFGSLLVGYGVMRRPRWSWLGGLEWLSGHHWSWVATIVIGVGQVVWITLELVSIPFSFLMAIFGPLGLALALLPLSKVVRTYLEIG
jgi:hypothetical protein